MELYGKFREIITMPGEKIMKQSHGCQKICGPGKPWKQGRGALPVWNALLTFPAEIWDMILKRLHAPSDLWSLYRSSAQLEEILKPEYELWLFELILPHVFMYLRSSEVYKLRLTCKTWCATVDSYLENHPSVKPYDTLRGEDIDSRSLVNIPRLTDYIYCFNHINTFTNFQRKVEGHPRNPFLGRSVSLAPKEDVYLEIGRYFNQAVRFFTTFGDTIWYVTFINFTCMFLQTPLEFYRGFRDCLVNLPNMKSLELEVVNIIKGDEDKNTALVQFLQENPLPPLNSLESLDLTINDMPPEFHEMFFTLYAVQLRKLNVKLTLWKEMYGVGLENLTELQLRHVRSLTMLRGFLRNLNSPFLQKFSLFLGFPLGVTVLFQLLARFEHLRILKVTSDRGATTQARLTELVPLNTVYLPSLQTLELQDSPKLTYAFLVGLPLLQSLVIWKNKVSRGEEMVFKGNTIVQLRKYICSPEHNSLYCSNIWEVLPKLKYLTVKCGNCDGLKPTVQHYTRQKYECIKQD